MLKLEGVFDNKDEMKRYNKTIEKLEQVSDLIAELEHSLQWSDEPSSSWRSEQGVSAIAYASDRSQMIDIKWAANKLRDFDPPSKADISFCLSRLAER